MFYITEAKLCRNYNFEYHWFELGFESENDGPHSREDQIMPTKPMSVLSQLIESDNDCCQSHHIKVM